MPIARSVFRYGYSTGVAAPPPPPTPGDLSTSFTLNSSTTGTKEFVVGHAFVQGDISSIQGVSITGAEAQITPKNYWPDGSWKYAIVAGTYVQVVANTAVSVSLSAGTSPTGTALSLTSFKAAMSGQTCSIACGAFGTVSWSGTDWDTPFQTWVSGHRMSSWLYRKPVGSDAHLVGWLEVRYYSTGAVEILPWVENGYLTVAAPTNKSATYTFTLGSTVRYSGAIDLPHHTRTVLLDGTKVSHWLGTDPNVSFKHNVDYLSATLLVPTYDTVVSPSAAAVTNLPTTFTPLMAATSAFPNADGMGTGGFGNHVALLPEWDVLYLTTSADVVKAVQWMHYANGRYAIHYRDPGTNQPLRFSQYVQRSLWQGSETQLGVSSVGNSGTADYEPEPTGTAPAGKWTRTHQPSVGFFPYLLTGRYYFLEECQFAATLNYLAAGGSYRNGTSVFRSDVEQPRGFAWDFRTLCQAACITPDSDSTLRTEFIDSVEENALYYYTLYVSSGSNPFGFVRGYGGGPDVGGTDDVTAGDNQTWMRVFMQDFVTACVGYGKDLVGSHLSTTPSSSLTNFFNFVALSATGRMGGADSAEYLYRSAAPYNLALSSADDSDMADSGAPWLSNWGSVYSTTYSGTQPDHGASGEPYAPNFTKADGGNLGGGYFGDSSIGGGRWGYLQPAIAYAARNETSSGITNTGWSKIRSAPNWYLQQAAYEITPIAAIVPQPLPKWRRGQAINEWREISGSSMSNTPPSTYQQFGGSSIPNRVDNWNGFALDTRTNCVWGLGNGGHGDYFGNEVMKFDLSQDEPTWVEWLPPTPYSSGFSAASFPASYRHYDDPTRLTGSHSYYTHQMIERQNRVVRVYSGSTSSGAGTAFDVMDGYNVTAAQGVNGTDPEFTFPNPSGSTAPYFFNTQGPATCKDPDTESIYMFKDNGVCRKFTLAASGLGGTWSNVGGAPPVGFSGYLAASAFDTRRGRILIASCLYPHASNSMRFWTFDTNTNAYAEVTGSMSGGATLTALLDASASPGMVYVPKLDAYFVRRGIAGDAVYKIDASTWAVTALTTSGGSSIPATADMAGDLHATYENVYSKWLFVPSLRGIMYYPRYTSNIWFLRLY